jgi:conjugal transfer ATP-binding protein TraC
MIEQVVSSLKNKSIELLDSCKTTLGVDEASRARNAYRDSMGFESLSSLLPYLAYDESSELFILDAGDSVEKSHSGHNYLGFAFETNPQTGATDSMEKVLQSLYLQSPKNTSISIHLYASPDIMTSMRKSESMKYRDFQLGIEKEPYDLEEKNIYRVSHQRAMDYYSNGTGSSLFPHGNNFLLKDFRMIVSVATPFKNEKNNDVEEAILLREQIKSTLASGGFPSFKWKPENLINFVADFTDHSRMFDAAEKIQKDYDNNLKIREQIISRDNEFSVDKTKIVSSNASSEENTCLVQLSVAQYPKNFHLSRTSSLVGDYFQDTLSYPCPFMITTTAVVQDYEKMRNRAAFKSATAIRRQEGYMSKFDPLLAEEATEWKYALSTIDDGGTLIKMNTCITLVAKEKEYSKVKSEVMAIWRSQGFKLTDDRYQQLVGFLSAMPMAVTPALASDLEKMKHFSTKYSNNAISLSPCIADWKGTQNPVVNFFGRRGQVMGVDLFDNKSGNMNFAVVGASGSGKTFVTQDILMSYRSIGAKVWVIDVGRGYENICRMIDGEFIEFTEESKICVNPFSNIIDLKEDMDMLKPLVSQMMSPDKELGSWEKSTIEQAITAVFSEMGNSMTMTDLAEHLLKEGEELNEKRKHDLGIMLYPWTKNGAYGAYFEGDANITFTNDFTVLELEELKAKPHLQSIVLMIMMYRISQEMYLSRDRKKIVLIDEAWQLLTAGGTGEFIENGYRRARRYGGAFGCATQSYSDFTGGAKAALINADWTFTLRQKEESIVHMEAENILSINANPFLRRTISDLKKVDGEFSEVYISCPEGGGLGRFVADPFRQILYSSSQEHFQRMSEYKKQGFSIVEAVDKTMLDFGMSQIKKHEYK